MRKIERGYTLVELLTVIGIISVLSATVITVFNPLTQLQKSRDAKRKADLKEIQKSLELYYQDNGVYPVSITFGAAWSPYMAIVPRDPSTGRNYVYQRPNTQTYYIFASLERGNQDPSVCNAGAACTNAGGSNCGSGATCNFGVSSSNVTP